MLDGGKKKAYSDTKVVTVIGQGSSVVGELVSKGTIRVEGSVSGRIECDDTVVVMETGRIRADIVAGQVIISGEIEGNVFAHDRIEINTKGRLIGDITAPRVSMADGVLFEGKCTMKAPGQAKPPVTTAVASPDINAAG